MNVSRAMLAGDEIVFERQGGLLTVTLNRARALNALSFAMCRAIHAGLPAWGADHTVRAVLIKGAGERAFCAGGDIRWLYEVLLDQGPRAALEFYAVEYPMNARLRRFAKPYIALLDGITMGGGVGVAVHGSHRVASERTVFAMPETGIGFFPDVGATWFLPRLPGALGMYLGLTGARLGPADCLAAGIATHFVPSTRHQELEGALAAADLSADPHGVVNGILARFGEHPGAGELGSVRARIDACFGQDSLEAMFAALRRDASDWSRVQLDRLAEKSPMSLAVAFRQLKLGAALDFPAAMRLEYRLVHHFMAGHDFKEGVRALIVDKDNAPQWRPARFEDVHPAEVDAYFAPLADGDLRLD